jgi:hypothetical protein
MDLRPPPEDRDELDPFAAPRAAAEPALLPGIPFTVADLLHQTWTIYQARVGACLAAYWGAAAAAWLILQTLTLVLTGLNDAVREPVFLELSRFLAFSGIIIIPAWMQIGQNRALLKIARREPVAIDDLFRGGPYLLTTLLAMLVLLAAAGTPLWIIDRLTEAILSESHDNLMMIVLTLAMGIGLGMGVVLAVLVRLGFSSYLIFDRGAGVWESVQGSWHLTRGQVATVILVYLAHLTVNFAGLLAFCVGLVFTLPLTSLLLAVTYQALSEGPLGLGRSGTAKWDEERAS